MKYKEIVELLKKEKLYVMHDDAKDFKIKYITANSKDVKKESLFICKGFTFKEEYLYEAVKNGAICYVSEVAFNIDCFAIIVNDIRKAMAVIAKHFYDSSKKYLFKIGITGTKGKTTTVYFLHNIFNEWQKKQTAFFSTIDYYTGKSSGTSHNTTPDSLELYKYFGEMKKSNQKYCVMEVSSQAVKLDRIYGTNFEMGAFLNIGTDHISPLEHLDFNEYLNCKIEFLKLCKKVFIYRNMEQYDYIVDQLKDKEIITFGFTEDCDYVISNIIKDETYTTFSVTRDEKAKDYKILIHGKYNCINATCAAIIAEAIDISYEDIYKGLIKTKVLGRMTIFEQGICPIIVDYAHNKLSIENYILALKEDYPGKNLKFVVGCPGDRGVNRREEVGELMSKYSTFTYLTAEDPQTKKVEDICEEIISYMDKNSKYEVITDRESAIIKAIEEATKDDVISIIGKGDETYQIINGIFVDYKSDIVVVEEQLNKITI